VLSTRWELGSIAGIDFKTTPSHSATMFRVRTQQGSKDNVLIGRLIATANAHSAPLAALPDVEEPANRPMAADAVAGVGARKHRRPQQERDFGGHRPALFWIADASHHGERPCCATMSPNREDPPEGCHGHSGSTLLCRRGLLVNA